MNISGSDLLNEWARASTMWVAIGEVNEEYGLPPYLLHAVGSRETNLTNEIGDNGHGHGIFQLDDRFHVIPPGFDNDVTAQAITAALMLVALFHKYDDWTQALNAYNSGSPNSADTAGGDYGPDVMQRQVFLLQQLGASMSSPVWDEELPNHYHDSNPNSAVTMTAADTVSWAATHAAHAVEAVNALRADLPGLVAAAVQGAVISVQIQQGKTTP